MRNALMAFSMALMLLPSVLVAASHPDWDETSRRNKADYYYLESRVQELADDVNAAYLMLSEAQALNPADRDIAFDLSLYLMQLLDADERNFDRAYAYSRDYYRAHPDDYYSALVYGTMCEYAEKNDTAIMVWRALHKGNPESPQMTYRLANALLATSDTASLREAAMLYDELASMVDDPTEFVMRKSRILYAINDTASMLADAVRYSAPPGVSSTRYILAAQIYEALSMGDSTLVNLQRACEADSTNAEAFYILASYHLNRGDSVGYEREIYRALSRQSLDLPVKIQLMKEYVSSNIDDSAMQPRIESLFAQAVAQYPHEPGVRNLYGAYLATKERNAEAAEQYGYSLDIEPKQEGMWGSLAQLYFSDQDLEHTLTTVETGTNYYPDDAFLYYIKALALVQKEDYDNALGAIDRAITLTDSVNPVAQAAFIGTRADILHETGQVEEAYDTYRKALSIDPENALVLNNFAYFMAIDDTSAANLDEAEEMAKRAIMLDPDNLNAVDTYAWVLFKKKDYRRAREVYDSSLADMLANPDVSDEVYEHAGDIYFMTGDADDALDFWKQALERKPDDELLQRKVKNKTYFFK